MPSSSAVLDVLKDESLLERIAEIIWQGAKAVRKGDNVPGVAYETLLAKSSGGRGGGPANDHEKLPEALRDFSLVTEEEDINGHLGVLAELEANVLSTKASPDALRTLASEVEKVRGSRSTLDTSHRP